jgi:hypothetical protein
LSRRAEIAAKGNTSSIAIHIHVLDILEIVAAREPIPVL